MNSCKICFSDTTHLVDEKTSKVYHKCINCDYIFLDKLFYIDEEREKKHYDKHHNNLESDGYVKMFEDLVQEFVLPQKDFIKSSLDYGCGEGEVLPIILERNGINCDRYDLFYFPNKTYEDKVYDLIVSTEVIEHLANPIDILKELIFHLKKGGFLVIMTAFHPLEIQDFFKWWYIRDITHIGFFTVGTFEYLAQEMGLKVLKHNSKNTIMFQKLV